jgi:hypothetical protein
MSDEVWIESGSGRTLSINIRLFTDNIASGGKGYVKKRHAWFKGDVGFKPNPQHDLRGIGNDPIMFNDPDVLVAAVIKAATRQGVTLLDPKTRDPL